MNSNAFLLAVSLVVGLAVSSAKAEGDKAPAEAVPQARTIQGYAAGCSLYLFDGVPVLKVNLYETQADAVASKTTPKAPKTDAVLDLGPGLTLLKANPKSAVKLICAAIMAQNAEKPIVVRANAQNVVESVVAYNHDIKSDSFALMPPSAQQAIVELLKALMDKGQEKGDRDGDVGLPPGFVPELQTHST